MKIGIVGLAHGHAQTYIRRWQENPEMDIQVARIWDPDKERLEEIAKNYNLEMGECPYCIVNDPEIEAVLIASETSRHAEYVEIAAEAGKKIVVQKPMALTIADADRIVNAVKKHNVPFSMAWQMRVDPQNVKMKEMLEAGTFGKIMQFQRRHNLGNTLALKDSPRSAWHITAQYNRDIWADDSSHPIDLVHWLFGMPESVTAELKTQFSPDLQNDSGIAIFSYPDGMLAEVCCTFMCGGAEKTTEILGSKGYLTQRYGDGVTSRMPRPENAVGMKYYLKEEDKWYDVDIPSPPNQGYRIGGLAQPISDFLHGKRGPIATAEEARDSLRLVLATIISSKEGRRVKPYEQAIDEIPAP